MDQAKPGKLELKATKTVQAYEDLYIIIDFLNKNLKEHQVMLGLTKNTTANTMTISLYEI